jgi:hypothetical protein
LIGEISERRSDLDYRSDFRMNKATPTCPLSASSKGPLRSPARKSWNVSRGVTVLIAVNFVILPLSIVARLVDNTTAVGVSVWDKPAKFALSFLAFGSTLIWLFAHVERTKWIRRGLGVLGWSMVLEGTLITAQSFRGRASHFNNETVLDAAIFQAMAAGVGVFTIGGIIVGAVLARKRLGNGALGLATKIGVPMMTAGATLGFMMTRPKPGQTDAGDMIGGHTNGAADGGPGIGFLGWSTEAGDFRVAHFFGLHSLQVLPVLAIAITALVQRGSIDLNRRGQRLVTSLGAAAWAGFVSTTLIDAIREVPFTAPDSTTLATVGVLAGVPLLVACVVATKPPLSMRTNEIATSDGLASPNSPTS